MPHTALRRHRLERGLDQAHVAKLVGVSQASISHYESGASYPLSVDVQRALRNLFGVPVPTLFAPDPGTTNAAPKGGVA
jgi:transcriptional regulator with XRE-family HTH domain